LFDHQAFVQVLAHQFFLSQSAC